MDTEYKTLNDMPPTLPRLRTRQVLVASREMPVNQYLAFPCLLRTGNAEVLITFKRGSSHALDQEADLDMVRFNTVGNRVEEHRRIAHSPGVVLQMGEWVRYPNGDIASYIDAQITGIKKQNYRTGVCGPRSNDGGKTFGELEHIGPVQGVEYGYPMESRTIDSRVYLVVMAFEYLAGRKGSVDVICSSDNGTSWQFVRDLSREFGNLPINETSFIPYGPGYLLATRGYDSMARLHRTDDQFKLEKQVDITKKYSFIQREIGRPRLFEKNGRYYLLGRNYTTAPEEGYMKECLFRIDPENLTILSWAILDNHEEGRVIDGYYPVCYWQKRQDREYFNVIDYKSTVNRYPGPDIIRHEFDWSELR